MPKLGLITSITLWKPYTFLKAVLIDVISPNCVSPPNILCKSSKLCKVSTLLQIAVKICRILDFRPWVSQAISST